MYEYSNYNIETICWYILGRESGTHEVVLTEENNQQSEISCYFPFRGVGMKGAAWDLIIEGRRGVGIWKLSHNNPGRPPCSKTLWVTKFISMLQKLCKIAKLGNIMNKNDINILSKKLVLNFNSRVCISIRFFFSRCQTYVCFCTEAVRFSVSFLIYCRETRYDKACLSI